MLAALLLGGAGDVVALGPGTTLLAAIDASSIHATSDPHVFALRDARGRAGQIGELSGNGDLAILPEYQNVCVNPNFYDGSDANTVPDSWTTASTVDGTIQYETNENSAVRIAYTALASDVNDIIMLYSSDSVPASPGDRFYLSAGVNGRASGVSAFLMLQAYNNGNAIGNKVTYMPVSSLTERLSVSYNLPVNTNGIRAFIYIDSMDSGDSVDIRISSINLNSSGVVRECTGRSGCYWSGATDNSYSIHPPETMYVTGVETARAIELWWTPDVASSAGQMAALVSDDSDTPYLMVDGDGFSLDVIPGSVQFSYPFNAGEPLHIVARWDNGLSLAVNGEIHSSGSGDYGDLLSTVYLGVDQSGVAQCNGELSAVRFYNTVSDADVATLYNSGAGLSVDEVADIREFVQGEEGAFMVDPVISYGEGGTIVAVMSVASVLLLIVAVGVANWLR